MRIRLIVEYDGGAYFGWQFQKGQRSVQEEMEKALQVILKKNIRLTASGRTDSGVHARNQIVHCDIPDFDLSRLKRSLNGLLDRDIAVKSIDSCREDFHARFDAKKRCYSYTIALQPTALRRKYSWLVFSPLNLTLLQKGAALIKEFHDFRTFCKVRSDVKNYLCDIFESRWQVQEGFLIYEICANRFLHGMVRAITGHLVDLGKGAVELREFIEIIESGDRRRVKTSAPPQGLVLENVFY